MRTIRVLKNANGRYYAELSKPGCEPITTASHATEKEALRDGKQLAKALKTVSRYVAATLFSRR